MQKNDKYYTFLLSHSLKSKFYIRKVKVSKKLLHFSVVSLFLVGGFSLLGAGISQVFRYTEVARSTEISPFVNHVSAQIPQSNDNFDYSRPAQSNNYAVNSGGPALDTSSDPETREIDMQLTRIKSTADPAFIPSIWSHVGKINNEFGFRRNPFGGRTYEFHPGMDIDGERGDLVVAPANGTVIKAGYSGGYGNMVEIDHGNGLTSRYGHLSRIDVEVGDTIVRGQLLGLVGSTGRSTGPHLHYEMRLNDRPINPRHFLPPEPMEIAAINKQ
jgi:murein DD-endopeptidase MepM/ murein hydrolase activator NlpD